MIEKAKATAVSVGYDHIRFIGPIFIGDTVTVTYTIAEIDEENCGRAQISRSPTIAASCAPSPSTSSSSWITEPHSRQTGRGLGR